MLKTIDYEAVFNGLMITFAVRTPINQGTGKVAEPHICSTVSSP